MNPPAMLCSLMLVVVLSSQSISAQFTLQDYRNHLTVSILCDSSAYQYTVHHPGV